MSALESGRRREKVTVLRAPEVDGVYADPEKIPWDLLSPLGSICNNLRLLKDAKSAEEQRKLQADITDVHLPRLQSVVSFWAKDERAGAAITLEKIKDAMMHVEGGGRALRNFAVNIVSNATTIAHRDNNGRIQNRDEVEKAVDRLQRNDRFRNTLTYVSYLEPNLSDSVAFELLRTRTKEAVEHVLVGRGEKKSTLWKDGDLSVEKIRHIRETAFGRGTGLDTTAERLLHIATYEEGGVEKRVRDAIEENNGRFRLLKTSLQDPIASAQDALRTQAPRDLLVVDRPFRVTEGERARFLTIDAPLSKITYSLLNENKDTEDGDVRTFPIDKSIVELKATIHARLENIAAQGETQVSQKDRIALESALTSISERSLRDAYRSAKKDSKKPFDRSFETGTLAAHRDPFVQLDRALGSFVFATKASDGRSIEQIFIDASAGRFSRFMYGGVWHEPQVTAAQFSENTEENLSTKTLRTLEFINSLPSLVENALQRRKGMSAQAIANVRLAANAFHNIVMGIELRRRMDEAVEGDVGERKGRASQTAGIQSRYAEAYGALFNRSLVAPIPARPEYPEQQEDQDDAAYMNEMRAFSKQHQTELKRQHHRFEIEQGEAIIDETLKFLDRLYTKQDLRGVFFGTLRFASGLKDADALKKAMLDEMNRIKKADTAPRYEDARTPQQIASGIVFHPELGLRQPREALRDFLGGFAQRCENAEVKLQGFFEEADELYARVLISEDPGSLIEEIQNLRDTMDGQLHGELVWMRRDIQPFLAEEKARESSDEAYRSLWRQTATPHIERFVRALQKRNDIHDTVLLALAVGYLREGVRGIEKELKETHDLSSSERAALEKQIHVAKIMTSQYAYPHMLNKSTIHQSSDGLQTEIPSFKQILPVFWGSDIVREFSLERMQKI